MLMDKLFLLKRPLTKQNANQANLQKQLDAALSAQAQAKTALDNAKLAVNLDHFKEGIWRSFQLMQKKATTALNNANNTLSAAQKALDEARNAQTAAADKLGTTNPTYVCFTKAANDAQTKVNETGNALEEANADLKTAWQGNYDAAANKSSNSCQRCLY